MTEQEELKMLRALVEKQKLKIEKQEDTIRRQNVQIEGMLQALLHAKKQRFGRSCEASQISGQMSLFETTEELVQVLEKEEEKISVPTYTRKPRKPGVRKEMLACIPKEVEEYIINEEDTCSKCGSSLKVIGKEIVRTEVEYRPAKLIVKQIVRQIAKCTECGTDRSTRPNQHFEKAAVPANVLSHSIATPSLVGHVLQQKYAMGIPLNRMETEFYSMGLVATRAQLSHWVIRCCEDWLKPIYNRMHEILISCEILHMDETRIQVNKEEGRLPNTNSFMWVIQSGACEKLNATFFYYSRNRNKKVALDLLKGFRGYLTTDAYNVYEYLDMEGIQHNFCWAHVRRKFIESIPLDTKGKEIPGSKGDEARGYIDSLFHIEKKIKELSYEEKKDKRQVASRAALDAFWSWCEETKNIPTTNEKLTKALNYAMNHRVQLEAFLLDGRLEISNNLCESHIRPFATGRKSWLFADTPQGATASAVAYTLAESAKANGLNVYEYFRHILTQMPNVDFYNHPEEIEKLLPWSDELPEICRLAQKYKKHLEK